MQVVRVVASTLGEEYIPRIAGKTDRELQGCDAFCSGLEGRLRTWDDNHRVSKSERICDEARVTRLCDQDLLTRYVHDERAERGGTMLYAGVQEVIALCSDRPKDFDRGVSWLRSHSSILLKGSYSELLLLRIGFCFQLYISIENLTVLLELIYVF